LARPLQKLHAVDAADHGRFAGRAENHDALATLDVEIDVSQRMKVTIP
jgi:hypothetical protein